MNQRRGNSRRFLLFVDQGLYAASNFLLTVAASALLAPEEAGALAVVFLTSVIAIALNRALVGEPLAADSRRFEPAWFSRATGSALGTSCTGAALIVVGAAVLATVQAGEARLLSMWAALWVPAVMLQDTLRYVGHARERYAAVVKADALWLLIQIAGVAGVWAAASSPSASLVLTTWGTGALVSCALLVLVLRPPLHGPKHWLRAGAPLGRWLLAQQSLGLVSGQVLLLFLGAALGAAALGGLRAAQSIFMPVGALFPAALILALNQDRGDQQRHARARHSIAVAVPAATAFFVLLAVLVAPPLMGRVYGTAYREFAPLTLPLGLAVICQAAAIAPGAKLRAGNRGRAVLASQVIATAVGVPLVVVLVVVAGVRGAAWGLAAQALALAASSWWLYVHPRAAGAPTPVAVSPRKPM